MRDPLRSRLLAGAAAAALGLALLPADASAQAFDGNPVVAFGSITRTTGAGTETISVDTPSAVVNWIPNSNADSTPFDFLPAGNVATFRNGASNENFMILNRILPDNGRPIAFNGTVISQLVSASGTVPGGTVVFYTPGGILIGAKAVFNVGNLLLTTIDPLVDGNGNFFVASTYQLSGPVNPKSFVRIEPGAQISAVGAGSYVAIASPVIEQFGAVRVNGSIAYVAAESTRLTINSGLFDIEVKVGSSSAAATIDHRGSTGGPGSDGPGDNQIIYMVAVPKNAAISLLLRGSAGYDVAAGATEENGAIILSAGYNVNQFATQVAAASDLEARIDIRQANISSDLTGIAFTSAVGTAFGGETLRFAGDVALVAPEANLGSEGGLLTVGGNALLNTGRRDDFNFNAANGGKANLFARGGGIVQIAGSARISASARSPVGEDAAGGDAIVSADNGAIAIGGDLRVEAEAEPGIDSITDPGAATGGNARIDALGGGLVAVAGSAEVTAAALGGTGFGVGDATPGPAQGGNAGVAAAGGGRVDIGGALAVRATGLGGSVFAGTPGAGLGGEARLQTSTDGRIAVAGPTRLDANGTGGTGASETPVLPDVSGGAGTGGNARVLMNGGTVQLDALLATAIGTGGAATGAGPNGGNGAGGLVELNVAAGGLAARDSLLQAFGTAGAGPNATGTGGNVVATGAGAGISGERLVAQAGVGATLGGVRMTNLIDAIAQRRIAVTGPAAAATVTLASRDIDVPASGSIGAANTDLVTFQVLPSASQTLIGGTAAGPGYTLDRNELSRVRGRQITLFAPALGTAPGRPPDLLVDGLTLAAGLQPSFDIVTPGKVRVVGDVLMAGAGAGSRLSFLAGERFEVITPAGSLRMLDAAGNPAGSLRIQSAHTVVADAGLAGQLAADPNFAGRNLALLVNPAPANLRGYIEAGGVNFVVVQPNGNGPPGTLFVQNTGPNFATLAGVTVGAGGLTVSPAGLASVQGFGRRQNADGSFTTGDAFFRMAAFDRAGGAFTDDSEFNRCNINSGLCPQTLPGPGRPALTTVVLGPLLPPEAEPRDDVIDASGLADTPLIDEPVTSGGDSSLWSGDDDDEEEDDE
ncbi:MAG TPA: hypothetical protein VFZ91_13895 [Allosphingosinicella sp.]